MDQQPAQSETENSSPSTSNPPVVQPPRKHTTRKLMIGLIGLMVLMFVLMALIVLQITKDTKPKTATVKKTTVVTSNLKIPANMPGLHLESTKNYGNKYKDGILPVGDGKYTTDSAKKGYVYTCNADFVPAGQAGAQARGPWFVGTTSWDVNKKIAVSGDEVWGSKIDATDKDGKRIITTNDLPNHVTGIFPVKSSDPAYAYDSNPNSIKGQDLTYSLSLKPVYGTPHCMGGEVGVMLTGVALFNAFDAGGRDAGAWEVQDSCNGHPQAQGEYHYHSLSSCILDTSVNTVIGFALDGFPITGPKLGKENILTTSDLDDCHGIVGQVEFDNKKFVSYHYVMTQDFPYSASCFRATPINAPGIHQAPPRP
jgi:hypothetical protein